MPYSSLGPQLESDSLGLLPVSAETLNVASVVRFNLYVRSADRRHVHLYRERNRPITQEDIEQLSKSGTRMLYIAADAAEEYRQYLRQHVLVREDLKPIERYQILQKATRTILTEALTSTDTKVAVNCTNELSTHLVETVCDTDFVMDDVLRAMAHDYSVFTHSLNVATYALLLARRFGMNTEEELRQIGQGALLHDIGKQQIPHSITQKPGKLTEQERRIVQRHPNWGFRQLCQRPELTWGQLMMVYQHHERCDGRGYPVCSIRSEIHEYARLCAIVDVYDAATRDRPDRRASRKEDILDYLDRQAGRGFDEEMTRCWIATVMNNT